jgi:thiamine transport system ATP-binding protein
MAASSSATAATGGAELHVVSVTVRFPDAGRPALDGVDLEVAVGEVVAVLGPSGCGKTTLLRVIAGLVTPDAGRVVLDGRDLTTTPVHRRGIGLMFQDHALFPHRDVGGNVEFGLRMAGMAPADRRIRVAEVLALVGLEGWERRPVGPLSGGERQRVALARALAPSPRLLLLDEPLGALDRTLRDRLIPELGELFRAVGVSVVHVTHDHGEALAIADRVVVMREGRVAREGTPVDLWRDPGSAFVARFLGVGNVVPRASVEVGSSDPAEVLVRPGAVRLEPVEGDCSVEGDTLPEPDGRRAMVAEVVRVRFEGERCVVSVRTTADGPVLDATVDPVEGRRWRVGTLARLSVDPEGIVAL